MIKNCVKTAALKLEVGALSETGYVRSENQDRMSGKAVSMGQLYIVADGMGGHKGGALAAELTIYGLQRHIGEAGANASVETVLRNAFTEVNAEVHRKAHSGDPATDKMGSTAVLLLIRGRTAWLAHVGDSRAYLYRKRSLNQLTKDHTWVQKMVDQGMLKPEEAQNHPNASQLSRAIGHKPNIQVDIRNKLNLNDGDAILLCSDGLCGYVSDPEIVAVLESGISVQQIPEQLVRLALKKGGEDNITVQFIQCGRDPGTHKRKSPNPSKLTPTEPKPLIRPVFQWLLALLLFTAIGLIGHLQWENLELRKSTQPSSPTMEKSDNQSGTANLPENEPESTETEVKQTNANEEQNKTEKDEKPISQNTNRPDNKQDEKVQEEKAVPVKAKLFVETEPSDSVVKVMNIRPKFHQGHELNPGDYQIKVSANGYESMEKWVSLDAGDEKHLNIQLKKKE